MKDLKAALLYLSGQDDDRASTRNDRGFNGRDTGFGNDLAEKLQAGHCLSPSQYRAARKMVQTYRVQVQKGTGIDVSTIPDELPTDGGRQRSAIARQPGTCAACAQSFPAGEMVDFEKRADGTFARSHAGGLCPSRVTAPEPVSSRDDTSTPLPWKDQPARTYEQVFEDGSGRSYTGGSSKAAELVAAVTEVIPAVPTGLNVISVLGPGGAIAAMLPGYEHRPTQLRGAVACEQALSAGGHAVIEAGTGTGKSLMYLTAAINSGKRTLVSTADKALQGQIWLKDVPFLQRVYATVGREVKAALLKGRGNYACKLRVNELRSALIPEFKSPEAGLAWQPVNAWIDEQDKAGDLADLEMYPGDQIPSDLRSEITADSDSCIGKHCPMYAECFVEEAKARAERADIVVVNHALLMLHLAIKAASGGYVTVIPDGQQIVLDEAHHLEDIATDAFGVEITAARWNRLYARLERLTIKNKDANKERAETWIMRADEVSAPLAIMLETFRKRLVESKETVQRLGDDGAIIFPVWNPLSELADSMDLVPDWLNGADAERDQWEKLAKSVKRFSSDVYAANNRELDDTYVRYAELEMLRGGRVVLNVKPIDVSEQLRTMLFDVTRTVIATSATIATSGSMDYWRERVGCDEATELEVGSPFDYPRNGLLYLPEDGRSLDSSAARGRNGLAEYEDRLAAEIERVINATKGGVFVLFTSNKMLRAMHERLDPKLQGCLVLRQGQQNRSRLVEMFKAAHAEGQRAVLFGTKSFTEGVDVQGDALSVVMVDKFAFVPPGDPIWEARKDKITRDSGDDWAWFQRLAIPYATIAMKQAVGRLIRTQTDRGVVVILDGRATCKPYGPRIVRALPPFRTTQRLADVAAFFK